MTILRQALHAAMLAVLVLCGSALRADPAAEVIRTWYRLALELVRHTPTYSPPVASRSFAYLGVTAYEVVASGVPDRPTLAGQLNGLTALTARDAHARYDEAAVMQVALATVVRSLFANTGPSGQRAMAAMTARLDARVAESRDPAVLAASRAYGATLAADILAWAVTDGGAVIDNMGFAHVYVPGTAPGAWQPTSLIVQQQAPLLPAWGQNRPFAMPLGSACPVPPPPDYSEDPASAFYAQAAEVHATTTALTDDQMRVARFWADDPMLSPTPPGHWVAIALAQLAGENADAGRSATVLARLGIAVADGFIGCWHEKYRYDLLRPVTYIRRLIDPTWVPLLITPPFPEYPSGHSTQSGAAAEVLSAAFGARPFTDTTHVDDGMPGRDFTDFRAAASEAAMSRLYGGIHFRAAIEQGLLQGRCIAAHALRLRMGDN